MCTLSQTRIGFKGEKEMTTRWNLGVLFNTQELTMVYELLHDVKISHTKQQAKPDGLELKVCNKMMQKIEQLLLADGPANVEEKNEKKD